MTTAISGQSVVSKLYCQFLGNKDVKDEYKQLVYKAFRDFGVANPESISIKKMNNVGSIVALMPVSSFTAFGIWIDEQYFDSCSIEERTFQIYHEVAHYILCHHQKVLAAGAGLSLAGIVALRYCYKKLNLPMKIASTLASAAVIYLAILPNIVKRQEKQADIESAKKLLLLGNKDIVTKRIQSLSQSKTPDIGNLWWFSDREQVNYLQKIRN